MTDDTKPSLWQPVSPAPGSSKITDVTPEPADDTITSSATTVSSGVTPPPPPPRTPPSDRASVLPPGRPPRRGGLGGVVVAIVLVAVTLAALYALAPQWLPGLMSRAGLNTASPAPAPTPAPVVAGMSEAERQKLDAQLADLNSKLAAIKIPTVDPTLGEQIKKLQAQLDQLAKQASQPVAPPAAAVDPALGDKLEALTAELAKATERNKALEQRLADIEKAQAARQGGDQRSVDAARAGAIVSLAARLRGNVDAGRPFADDLAALKPLVTGDAELTAALAALEPLSSGGDGITALRQSFPAVARATVAAGKNDAADGWLERAAARLSSIVSVRRVGDVQGDSVEARVARAEAALNNGKLDAAVAELKPIGGTAGKALAAWLAKAERQLAVSKAADALATLAAQRLTAMQAR